MKKLVTLSIILSLAIACAGCTALLEGDTQKESLHVAVSNERPPDEQIEVSSYEELEATMLSLIAEHEADGLMVVKSYYGDVESDAQRAKDEILKNDPVAVYTVGNIDVAVTRIVSYFEIEVKIAYIRTKEQADSMITVSTQRYLRSELQSIMSEYREEAVFLTSMQITEAEMEEFIRDTYYQNPRSIVMMPVTVVTTLTAGGNEKIIELSFRYLEQASVLRQFGASLNGYVRQNAFAAEGENDAEILLSLVENLIGACAYDEGTARTISEHGVQNIAATAYNALVRGSAVGEGFAMAFKSLCDELGFDCHVVLGYIDGRVHAWNVVSLYGDYYHIDTAMCALNGVETAFIKNDADLIEENYSWDMENTLRCNGTLTYEDIVGVEEEVDDDTDDNIDGDEDGDADGVVDGEADSGAYDGSSGMAGGESTNGESSNGTAGNGAEVTDDEAGGGIDDEAGSGIDEVSISDASDEAGGEPQAISELRRYENRP